MTEAEQIKLLGETAKQFWMRTAPNSNGLLAYHADLFRAFSKGGFAVTRIEKFWFHNIWEIRLANRNGLRGGDERHLLREACRILATLRVQVDPENVVAGIDGSRLKVLFGWNRGTVGVFKRPREKAPAGVAA